MHFGHAGDVADQLAARARHDREIAAGAITQVAGGGEAGDAQSRIECGGQRVDEGLGRPARIGDHAEQPLLTTGRREAVDDADRVDRSQLAIDDHAQVAGLELAHEQAAIGQERDPRGPVQTGGEHLVLEPGGKLDGSLGAGCEHGQPAAKQGSSEGEPERRQ